ncbi:hypothetical protein AB0K43_24230 [Kitasatospora sp. NPDC049258]|uniref:hypothetical protein n=1 Tax=Kitasatospora sp. NPDC049258 TaxID=3155394 RepID=UPI00343F4C17
MATGAFAVHAPRFCRIRGAGDLDGDPFSLGGSVFSDEAPAVVEDPAALTEDSLATPQVVAAAGMMVLLGEPGAGKTAVLTELTASLPRLVEPWSGESDECVWVRGGDLTEATYAECLGQFLTALPAAGGTAPALAGVLTIVLDQADESGMLERLPGRLESSVRGRDLRGVRMLIACRSSDYPGRLTPVLTDAFGVCHRVDLAPLRRSDAVSLVDSMVTSVGVPGEVLVGAAEAAGAAALACVPLTLELLALTYQTDRGLWGTPQDLFARGVELLATDPDPDRINRTAPSTTVDQRMVVAGRIAAWMLLCGRRSVWRGGSLKAGPLDLPAERIANAPEATVSGEFFVTAAAVKETLATALFTSRADDRVAFRHSSLAAYLAAWYLKERGTGSRQLSDLFLVGAPDDATASIPRPLRETAAWLVALNPTQTRWLADADPESLAAHSMLVRSDAIRELIVQRLLERAAQVELSDVRWHLSRWALDHPGIAGQLADVLEGASATAAEGWPTQARVRLAVRLAREVSSPDQRLAASLLEIVKNDAWSTAERRLAADAASACDPVGAVPVLIDVFTLLLDPAYAQRIDPDDNLRGTLLSLLWPEHLDTETMLRALRQPRLPQSFGRYGYFLTTVMRDCTEEQLPQILDWTARTTLAQAGHPTVAATEPISAQVDTAIDRRTPGLPRYDADAAQPLKLTEAVVDPLIARTLRSERATDHLSALAVIIMSRLRDHHRVELPDPLQPDEKGVESPATRDLRRALAAALVEEAIRSGSEVAQAVWMVIRDWERRSTFRFQGRTVPSTFERRHLLDGADLDWALAMTDEAAQAGNTDAVEAYGQMADWIIDVQDPRAFELAYNQDHPAWPYLKHHYEPIALDSRLAEHLRRSQRDQETQPWPHADDLIASQRQRLQASRTGDSESFWQFLWYLQFDPATGQPAASNLAIESWPGAVALAEDLGDLAVLGIHYLASESDHGDTWLGQPKEDRRAWAGYLMLTHLLLHNRTAEVPSSAWGAWCAAILDCDLPSGIATEETRAQLLRHACDHAPDALARRVDQLFRANLDNGLSAYRARSLDPTRSDILRTALEDLHTELFQLFVADTSGPKADGSVRESRESSPAVRTPLLLPLEEDRRDAYLRSWSGLNAVLLAGGSQRARELSESALDLVTADSPVPSIAVRSAEALLHLDIALYWPRIRPLTGTSASFGRQLAESCADTDARLQMRDLDVPALAQVYRWLSSLYDASEEGEPLGVHFVSAPEQVRRWRDSVPAEMAQRATAESVHQLKSLTGEYPDRLGLAAALIAGRAKHCAASRFQAGLADVIQVLADPRKRLISTTGDLFALVVDLLKEVAAGISQHGELLWDRTPGYRPGKKAVAQGASAVPEQWRPKPEAALCAYLALVLDLRLGGQRVVVNREVLVHPTDAYGAGDRTDILIQANPLPAGSPPAQTAPRLDLVIEVKGAWNEGLLRQQETQLARRYLKEVQTDAGIYLVGWYPPDQWAKPDHRRDEANKHTVESLEFELSNQAAHLSESLSVHLQPMVMVIPRPHKEEAKPR